MLDSFEMGDLPLALGTRHTTREVYANYTFRDGRHIRITSTLLEEYDDLLAKRKVYCVEVVVTGEGIEQSKLDEVREWAAGGGKLPQWLKDEMSAPAALQL